MLQLSPTLARDAVPLRASAPTRRTSLPARRPHTQSYTSKGVGRQGIGSLCKQLLCFSSMPCRLMALLVHFRTSRGPGGMAARERSRRSACRPARELVTSWRRRARRRPRPRECIHYIYIYIYMSSISLSHYTYIYIYRYIYTYIYIYIYIHTYGAALGPGEQLGHDSICHQSYNSAAA